MASQPKSFALSPELHEYLVRHGTPPDEIQRELIEETTSLGPISVMQIAPEQGAFMTLLTRAIGARRAVEVGTFTGYSALSIARGLPNDGYLLCCDVNADWTARLRHDYPTRRDASGQFHNYVLVTVTGSEVSFQTRDKQGEVRDQGYFSRLGGSFPTVAR